VLGYLLRYNPKLYIKNLESKTPIDVAQNPEIIDIFGKYVNKIKMKVVSNSKRKTIKSWPGPAIYEYKTNKPSLAADNKEKLGDRQTIRRDSSPLKKNSLKKTIKNNDKSGDISNITLEIDKEEAFRKFDNYKNQCELLFNNRSWNPHLIGSNTTQFKRH